MVDGTAAAARDDANDTTGVPPALRDGARTGGSGGDTGALPRSSALPAMRAVDRHAAAADDAAAVTSPQLLTPPPRPVAAVEHDVMDDSDAELASLSRPSSVSSAQWRMATVTSPMCPPPCTNMGSHAAVVRNWCPPSRAPPWWHDVGATSTLQPKLPLLLVRDRADLKHVKAGRGAAGAAATVVAAARGRFTPATLLLPPLPSTTAAIVPVACAAALHHPLFHCARVSW